MNRIKEGYLLIRNPCNTHQVKWVSLLPEDVGAIVFRTRNPGKLLPDLALLEAFICYFQFRITGYPKILVAHGLNPHRAIEIFLALSRAIGRHKVVWRYDPVRALKCDAAFGA